MIRFNCNRCGQQFSVPDAQAGRKARCAKCKGVINIPNLKAPIGSVLHEDPERPDVRSRTSAHDSDLFDVSPREGIVSQATGPRSNPHSEAEDLQGQIGRSVKAEGKSAGGSGLPWFVDLLLYPLSLSGILHLACFWVTIFLLCPLGMTTLGLGIEYTPIVYALPIAYILCYFTECVRDGAMGRHRAPDLMLRSDMLDIWEWVAQSFLVLGALAFCFWPTAVYYVARERTDWAYCLLMACGGFFFPVVFLAVVLFDGVSGLNPLLILGSIGRTFIPYCGMVLLFFAGVLLFLRMDSRWYWSQVLPVASIFLKALQMYLIFVGVGLVGNFYHRHRKRLDWEV